MLLSTSNINCVFESLRMTFQEQDAVRDQVREKRNVVEGIILAAHRKFLTLHTTDDLHATTASIKQLLRNTGGGFLTLQSVLSHPNEFYRYQEMWCTLQRNASTIAIVTDFVDTNALADIDRVKKLCGGHDFQLPLIDYLHSVCNAISVFVRLSRNRMVMKDYDMPMRCTVVGIHVVEAFGELDLKNYTLRKRFDDLKENVKNLENIVYDLSVRGLICTKKHGDDEKDVIKREEKADMDTEE